MAGNKTSKIGANDIAVAFASTLGILIPVGLFLSPFKVDPKHVAMVVVASLLIMAASAFYLLSFAVKIGLFTIKCPKCSSTGIDRTYEEKVQSVRTEYRRVADTTKGENVDRAFTVTDLFIVDLRKCKACGHHWDHSRYTSRG